MSREQFVRETRSGIDRLADGLLSLEDGGNEDRLSELFRTAHTLKGNCSAAGFDAPARVAHALEDVLDAIRADRLEPDPDVVDATLVAADVLDAMVDEIAEDGRVRIDPDGTVETIRTLLETRATDDPPVEPAADDDTDQPSTLAEEAIPEPGSGDGLTAEEALERASGFDDLESLSADVDDGTLEGSGSLDELFDDEPGDEPAGVAADGPAAGSTPTSETATDEPEPAADETTPDEAATATEPSDVEIAGTEGAGREETVDFDRVRDDVETLDAGTMDDALEGVQFGDGGADDDVTVTELLELAETDDSDGPSSSERPASSTGDRRESPTADGAKAQTGEDEESTSGERAEPQQAEYTESQTAQHAEASTADRAERAMDAAGIDDQQLLENIQQLEPAEPAEDPGSFVFDTDVATSQEDGDTGGAADLGDGELDDDPGLATERSVTDGDERDFLAAAVDGGDVQEGSDATLAETSDRAVPDDALASFDRDANVREFVAAFGDSFDGSITDDRTRAVSDAVTTIPSSVLPIPSSDDDGTAREERGGTITVEGTTADRLLQLTERLTTATMALERDDGGSPSDSADEPTRMRELREIATDLEETVTAVRLQPLERAFSGLERTARRVAREAETRVDLETSGGSIELDRDVVAALGDLLVHLVRNAVDHGIEPADERERAGKSRTGTVAIRARKDADEVVLAVTDDGRGLDADELCRVAIEEGIVGRERAAAMSDEAAHELVFHPGLSTEAEVTDVSGRGVGMDVVAETITGLDGDIEVESSPGDGTTFRLRVPVSVAATEVLFVEADGRPYAIPAADIARLEEFDPARADGDAYAMTVTGEDEPETERRSLVRLSEWLGADGDTDPTVVVHVRDDRGGRSIACDDVGDWRRVVVRPYDDILAETPGIDGATLLGDGELANVLDVTAITDGGSR
ncbi:ATP-binding protein [Natrinema longum]|uniref:histidine kinase n=1 Tax=Natrinema longum TaxID=370324 RepID=A0A8A2U638_9EURY|nr:ATP-binding protein [Natrinema longum]MBZ6494597.1 Hpt domain-containing protein [Natrinema longum]QSW84083.1 Hpt domain-containing protein [Natrinema longum]